MDLEKKALIVGINDYKKPLTPLSGCVPDARRMHEVLSQNDDADESPNFDCKLLTSPDEVTRSKLKEQLEDLFINKADVVLFYFSGHGTINKLGGYLATEDYERYDPGISMADILSLANDSNIQDIIIIVDACHSGALGNIPNLKNEHAVLREGVSLLTASRSSELSYEDNDGGGGIFTSLIYEAFKGGAADILGNISVANIYAYVDQILGSWDQRPMFKINTSRLITLRKCMPHLDRKIIRKLIEYFPDSDDEYPLHPSYEETSDSPEKKQVEIMGNLQKFRSKNLLEPVGEEHLYWAAMKSKSCKLTRLGQFYWRLAKDNRI